MVKVRPARGAKGWEYDIRFVWPEGGRFRERANAPVSGRQAAQRWAEARERTLLAGGKTAHDAEKHPAPSARIDTLDTFWSRVVRDHYRANRKKPSTIEGAEAVYRLHIKDRLGDKALDTITSVDVAQLKGELAAKSPKTVNNVLSVLSRALRCAVEWGILAAMPCRIGFLKTPPGAPAWYELADYLRLVDAARKLGTDVLVLVLLAGSAGLRRGEIIALKWTDLDMHRRLIHVERGIWRGHEDTPKGGRGRIVPMTPELYDALKAHRHLKGERVLYSDRGQELSNRVVRNWLRAAQRRAGLPLVGDAKREKDRGGAIHMLRHTFCSHLAIAGAPAKAIQELAGHADLATTQRYMHLSPSNRSEAMATLAAYYCAAGDPAKASIG
jgi:integrase